MRQLSLLLAASSIAVAACGGLLGLDDKAYDPGLDPGNRAGTGGMSGGSGQTGAGVDQGGAGAASTPGPPGQGGDGQAGGLAGSAGQAGAGGISGTSGQNGIAGEAGSVGASGQAGAGGQGGASACTTSSSCQPPSDPCAQAVCNAQGVCELLPSEIDPPQTEGDCKQRLCDGATSVFVNKLDDAPDPNGQCDVVSCVDQKPFYTPDSSKCAPGFGCQVSTCVCLGCPAGELPGKPGQCRFGPMTSAYATDDVPSPGPVNLIVDGDLGTTWTSTFSPQYGVGHATVVVLLPEPVWMAELVFYPRYEPLDQYEGDPGLKMQGFARRADGEVAFEINASVLANKASEPIVIKAPQPVQVKKIEFDVNAYDSRAALFEVAYRACP